MKGIISKPLSLGSVFGIIFMVLKIQLPFFFEKTLSDLAKVATPQALII